MSFCLPLDQTKKFIQALKEGVIDPAKLADMSSEERHTFFAKLIGEDDAREVNSQFESKLLLKDQQTGMINWAKRIGNISEPIRRDIIARIEKMDKVLNPADQKAFLQDLASKKLGTDINFDEAKQIADLSKQLTEAKTNLKPNAPIGSPSRMDYGAKKVALQNYVNELKLSNTDTSLKGRVAELKQAPVSAIKNITSDIAGVAKGIKASLDDSAIFRQGWRTLFTDPTTWANNAVKTFSDIYNQVKLKADNNAILDGIKADIYSRPNAIDGLYTKMKLDIGTGEEAYPSTIPEKIPLFNRLYKASEVAYNGFLMRMRADIADKYIDVAKGNGIDLTDDLQARSIGKLVNSLTGRGSLGSLEKVGKTVNTIFFSPKSAKASFDFLTGHNLDPNISSFARKQAAINLLKVAGGIATILGTASAIDKKSVEWDPRSSDFGKIKVGDTRFDVTGGMASLVTLASRMLTLSSKSTVTGKVNPLNSGKFGATTGGDVFFNFLENKLSPAASIIKDIANGQDFNGNKPTLLNEAGNLFFPLPITNAQELMNDPKAANALIGIILDSLGINTNTYSSAKKPVQKQSSSGNILNMLFGAKTASAAGFPEGYRPSTATTTDGVKLHTVPPQWQDSIQSAYDSHPALQKYPGLLEAVLMQESSMGTNDKNYNPNIGESAWLGGVTKTMTDELARNGIKANVDTQQGVINAIADYLSLKSTVTNPTTKEKITYKDPVNLYLQRYKTSAGIKLSQAQVDKFRSYINYYKNS